MLLSLVIAKNICQYRFVGGLLHIILAVPLNKYYNPFLRYMSRKHDERISFVLSLFLTIALVASFTLTPYSGFASIENNNNTLMEPEASEGMATATNATNTTTATTTTTTTSANATTATPNIVLVHGLWADGSSWSKVVPTLQNAGHRVIAVQLAERSLAEDVDTVKRAIDLVGGPTIVVGHSF